MHKLRIIAAVLGVVAPFAAWAQPAQSGADVGRGSAAGTTAGTSMSSPSASPMSSPSSTALAPANGFSNAPGGASMAPTGGTGPQGARAVPPLSATPPR